MPLQVGFRACIVAVLGTILPLAAGTLLTMAYNKPFFPMGVAAGTALAPTSVGIALRLLGEAGVLKEDSRAGRRGMEAGSSLMRSEKSRWFFAGE